MDLQRGHLAGCSTRGIHSKSHRMHFASFTIRMTVGIGGDSLETEGSVWVVLVSIIRGLELFTNHFTGMGEGLLRAVCAKSSGENPKKQGRNLNGAAIAFSLRRAPAASRITRESLSGGCYARAAPVRHVGAPRCGLSLLRHSVSWLRLALRGRLRRAFAMKAGNGGARFSRSRVWALVAKTTRAGRDSRPALVVEGV